jgi:hypothetical protein
VATKLFVMAALLACGLATAQQPDTLRAASSQVFAPSSEWVAQNRFVELFVGQRHQDYLESDHQGLTPNGVLDTETGNLEHLGLALRWQGATDWLLHLQAQRQSGVTDYNGYMQVGNGTLSPYHARSGNTSSQVSLSLGYAFNAHRWSVLSPHWQITPLLQLSQYQWDRNLVQYSETYTHSNHAAGALIQWRARSGTVLELLAVQGRTQSASVSVPALGFSADQPGGSYHQWQISLSQDVASLTGRNALIGWQLAAHYSASTFEHAASLTTNGLQAPPNQHRPSVWSLGLQKQF